MKRTVINRLKNYCFSIRVARREVSLREERVGEREGGGGDAGKTNERTAKGVEEGNDARSLDEQGEKERENDGFSLPVKLLCRSLRAGRLVDHLLSSTRKLPDANRFVSGRFKRFTIIHTNPNSINASRRCRRQPPPFLHFVAVDRQRKSHLALLLSSLLCELADRRNIDVRAWNAR